MKKVLAIILAIVTVLSIVSISALAADNTNYKKYNEPESSGDYAYWSGSKVVKSSSTTIDEIRWMQAALNFCKEKIGLSFSSYLAIDGSFGPASKSATLAFQKKYGLSQDGSFGPATIKKMKDVLDKYEKSQNKTTNSTSSTSSSSIVSPCTNRKISSPFQPWRRIDRSSKWGHMGIDYTGGSSIVAFYKGTVTKIWYNSSTGYSIEIKHSYNGKTFYSYYFHLKKDTYKVSQGSTVSTGQQIATMGSTGDSSGIHLHFQITSKSVVSSSGTVSVYQPGNNNKDKTKDWQSKQTVFSWNGIKWYNPEIVLTKGLSIITNN